MKLEYPRILIKLSGEALMADGKFGLDVDIVTKICSDIKDVHQCGHQICIVVGGGNICRGASVENLGIERANGDYMGMLATVINALALQSKLEDFGIFTRVQSAIAMTAIAEPYIRRRAIRHMEKGRIVIFAAGTGNPFFTTDTAAALRAAEMGCNAILKATHQVDGIYSSDPKQDITATKYQDISYKDVIFNELKIMDTAAITLARDHGIPILVFNIRKNGEINRVLNGSGSYSIIK